MHSCFNIFPSDCRGCRKTLFRFANIFHLSTSVDEQLIPRNLFCVRTLFVVAVVVVLFCFLNISGYNMPSSMVCYDWMSFHRMSQTPSYTQMHIFAPQNFIFNFYSHVGSSGKKSSVEKKTAESCLQLFVFFFVCFSNCILKTENMIMPSIWLNCRIFQNNFFSCVCPSIFIF